MIEQLIVGGMKTDVYVFHFHFSVVHAVRYKPNGGVIEREIVDGVKAGTDV